MKNVCDTFCAIHNANYRDNRSLVVLQEKKASYTGNNKSKKDVAVYKIDGGIITSSNIRKADYLLLVEESNSNISAYFIELKGKDIEGALEQLSSSIKYFEDKELFPSKVRRKHLRIASNRVPSISESNADFKRLKKRYNLEECRVLRTEII